MVHCTGYSLGLNRVQFHPMDSNRLLQDKALSHGFNLIVLPRAQQSSFRCDMWWLHGRRFYPATISSWIPRQAAFFDCCYCFRTKLSGLKMVEVILMLRYRKKSTEPVGRVGTIDCQPKSRRDATKNSRTEPEKQDPHIVEIFYQRDIAMQNFDFSGILRTGFDSKSNESNRRGLSIDSVYVRTKTTHGKISTNGILYAKQPNCRR